MNPGIRGGAKGEERRAVGIGEVVIVADGDRAMHVRQSGGAGEHSAALVESGSIAGGDVAPRTGSVGHEADLIRARAVVEAIYINAAVAQRKDSREMNIGEGISVGWAGQGELKDLPAGNRRMSGFSNGGRGRGNGRK